jgi:hypothetical protein
METLLQLEDLKLKRRQRFRQSTFTPLPAAAARETYLGARIPMGWIQVAGNLPGKAILFGLLLWHWGTMNGRSAVVRVRPGEAREAGVSRNGMYRALAKLEAAGLVSVARHRGGAAEVTILGVP